MREIKFRAWDMRIKKMMDGEPRGAFFAIVGTAPDKFVVMQYTGLKDKNGKDIYEGDVFFCNQCGENRVVEWMNEYAMFTFHRLRVHDGYEVDNEEIEVIGNIHENPELLTP